MRLVEGICTVIVCLIGISVSPSNADPKEQDFLCLYDHENE